MSQENHPLVPSTQRPALEAEAICDVCGRFGAMSIGERRLCPDCYEKAGSCCPEFGRDDLWRERDD